MNNIDKSNPNVPENDKNWPLFIHSG